MKPLKQALAEWFPVISRYIGIAGVLYEVVALRVLYHLPPDPTSVMVFAGMMGLAEVQSALANRLSDSQNEKESRSGKDSTP